MAVRVQESSSGPAAEPLAPDWQSSEDGRPRSRLDQSGLVLRCAQGGDHARWRAGERLEDLFQERCEALAREGRADALAVDGPEIQITYAELDRRSSRLARQLLRSGALVPGDRVGLLFDGALDGYVGMLAALKARAAFVPMDVSHPPDRLRYVAQDSGISTLLSRAGLMDGVFGQAPALPVLRLDELEHAAESLPCDPIAEQELAGGQADDLCYVIYTSGTTGRPKGVAVSHASVCNFVRVAAELYGLLAQDRVYQGLSTAFDFSFEEIWVPWMVGATLVPKPTGANLLGPELEAFLAERDVSALCCVPTLLGTLEGDLPGVRLLLLSGEPCPQALVTRWHRPDRRLLNVYGPTEATVSATWTILDPTRPVTIGVPLPTYSILVLDPDRPHALAAGQTGEIAIAGIGLAQGYLNLPETTGKSFVEDFLEIEQNPSGRIYRTGDLGRINEDGEIEHLGRIDTQVEIRGYRVELSEIESVLGELPEVVSAIASTYEPEPEITELVGYCKMRDGVELDVGAAYEHLRRRLPKYMVPAYLQQIGEVPVAKSGKVDRKRLPAPTSTRMLARQGERVDPASEAERTLAEALARTLSLEQVSVESHFFDELGASSLSMAQFASAIRSSDEMPSISMKEIYQHPTVRSLAKALERRAPEKAQAPRSPRPLPAPIGTPRFLLCGLMQALSFLLYLALASLVVELGGEWLAAAHGIAEMYWRAVAFGAATLVGAGMLPILAKWVLIGRWQEARVRVWSMAYLRFWIVKTLTLANPLAHLCVGSPLYPLYLRALGARIDAGAAIFTHHTPICTDLLSIGSGSVVRKDSYLNCYRAREGMIEIGRVTLGKEALVGEMCVLDIDTKIEDGAQLGHSSCMQSGQILGAGRCWHGSPPVEAPAGHDRHAVPPRPCSRVRRAVHSALLLMLVIAVVSPLEAATLTLLFSHQGAISALSAAQVLWVAAALLLGLMTIGLLLAIGGSRLLTRLLTPGKVYPLYGFHHGLQRAIARISNIRSLPALFGDSFAIVHYLAALGYRIDRSEQTGSNFGATVKQDVPALTEVGRGTMVSDGLSVINTEMSSSSFRVLPARIGANSFLGNYVAYPARATTGENCLLATKALVPISGPPRHDVGLLGSPCFEIPRSVSRDDAFSELNSGPRRRRAMTAKARHNLATMALRLFVRWLYLVGVLWLALGPVLDGALQGWAGTIAAAMLDLLLAIAVFTLAERALVALHPLRPRFCSIYQVEFWRHERFWKVPTNVHVHIFNGTALKGVMWRMLGVQVGARLFDDGCTIVERTLVRLGEHCTLNAGSTLQAHSLEDGRFKSDWIELASGCTVGTGALVHYGVRMGERSTLEADSFLMKGAHLEPGSLWSGNPAAELVAAPQQEARLTPSCSTRSSR